MRTPKHSGKGKAFQPGPKWLEQVMCSKRRRRDRTPINIGN
jgi:hypothetical protein